jgi:hypothetical protein
MARWAAAWAAWRRPALQPLVAGGVDPVPDHRPFEGLFTRLPLTAGDDLPESKKLP